MLTNSGLQADSNRPGPHQRPGTHIHTLHLLQANVHHAVAAAHNLTGSIKDCRVDVYLLQEPYVYRGKFPCIPDGFKALGVPHLTDDENMRAAIFVRKDLPAFVIPRFCNKDLCTISLFGKLFSSAYFPIEENSPPELLRELVSHCETQKLDLLVACDSNSHNTMWSSSDTNARGEESSRLSKHHWHAPVQPW